MRAYTVLFSALLLVFSVATHSAIAQPPAQPAAGGGATAKIPPPEGITMVTKDGVTLQGTYFGSNRGKKAIPVILLHGWERSRNDLAAIAGILQKEGMAVVTVDLRGHGASKSIQTPDGKVTEIDLSRVRGQAFETYVTQDLEAVKKFLMEKNNEGKCNIEMLTIIGCDFSAVAALQFAARDWSWPLLPAIKQGQDVKGLVLVSPPRSFQGFTANLAVKQPAVRDTISIMVIAGEGNRSDFSDAKRLYTQLEKIRAKSMEKPEDRTVFFAPKPVDLSGTALLTDPRANCLKDILFFTKVHLSDLQGDDPWTDRTSLLD